MVVELECVFASQCLQISALGQLRNIFGLGKREAETIMVDVTSKAYRRRLSQAVTSGSLEGAQSKAAFLQNLCDELHFDPQKASEIHQGALEPKTLVNLYKVFDHVL